MNIRATVLVFLLTNPVFAADHSSFRMSVGSGEPRSLVALYVIDSLGRKCGYDPTNISNSIVDTSRDATYGEILNCQPDREAIDSADTEDLGPESVIIQYNGPVANGVYAMVVFSTVSYAVPYSWDMSFTNSAGKSERMNIGGTLTHEISGAYYLTPGTTATYTISYDPTSGSVPTATKSVSFPILRQELQAAFQLKQIGGKRFVDELDDVLAQGERALARKDRHDDHRGDDEDSGKHEAVAKLREFITRLDKAAKTAAKSGHGDEHERDRDNRRFATAVAAQSLTSDAKTLIEQLGGKPDDGDRGRNDAR